MTFNMKYKIYCLYADLDPLKVLRPAAGATLYYVVNDYGNTRINQTDRGYNWRDYHPIINFRFDDIFGKINKSWENQD